MNLRRCEKYLRNYGIFPQRPLVAGSVEGIEQAVVIPALAERDSLFRTLAGIARNPPGDLQGTLVICVVNNHRPPLTSDREIADNQKTLSILQPLVFRRPASQDLTDVTRGDLQHIAGSDLRLAFIDASRHPAWRFRTGTAAWGRRERSGWMQPFGLSMQGREAAG